MGALNGIFMSVHNLHKQLFWKKVQIEKKWMRQTWVTFLAVK